MVSEEKLTVNIEDIMEEIRREARIEQDASGMPDFEDIPLPGRMILDTGGLEWPVMLDSLRYVNANYPVTYYWELPGGGLKKFIKRVIRKLVKPLLLPITEKLTDIHMHFVCCFNQLRYFAEEQLALNEACKQAVDSVQDYTDEAKVQMSELSARVAAMEKQLAAEQKRHEEETRALNLRVEELTRQLAAANR